MAATLDSAQLASIDVIDAAAEVTGQNRSFFTQCRPGVHHPSASTQLNCRHKLRFSDRGTRWQRNRGPSMARLTPHRARTPWTPRSQYRFTN